MIGGSTAEAFRATSGAGILCQATSSSATNACVFAGASSAANTKYVYLNISVWSNAQTAGAGDLWTATASDFYVQFHASNWDNGSTYYVATPTKAVTLSEPAYALAISTSAASIVALASCLY